MLKDIFRKGIVLVIIGLFIGAGFVPSIVGKDEKSKNMVVDEIPNEAKFIGEGDPGDWTTLTVDRGSIFQFCSLALDSNNVPHISYSSQKEGDLKYAYLTGVSSWNVETLDSNDGFQWIITSLALDSNDHPHICYCNAEGSYLKYAVWTGSNWDVQTVDDGQITTCSLVVDSNDTPHICYNSQHYGLHYAYWTGTSWKIEQVDSEYCYGASLILDNDDFPHISYVTRSECYLKYAVWTGSNWDVQTVDENIYSGGYSISLALDSNGYPHIGYNEEGAPPGPDDYVKYAVWTGSNWDVQTVDSIGDAMITRGCVSLALDRDDHPHITYDEFTWGELKYAVWRGSSWRIETVVNDGRPSHASLVLDSDDIPHISYFVQYSGELKYAIRNSVQESDIFINEIYGGFRVSSNIENYGGTIAYDVPWSIDLEGGLILAGDHTEGVIPELAPGATTTIRQSTLYGIGMTTITVTADDTVKKATGFVLGPLVLNVQEI